MIEEHPKKGRKVFHSGTLVEDYNKRDGYVWTIARGGEFRGVEVWTSSDTEVVHMRQEHRTSPALPNGGVDILSVTVGQAYDLIKALSRALEVPNG